MTSPDNEQKIGYTVAPDLPPIPPVWEGEANERVQKYLDDFVADLDPKSEKFKALEMYTRYQEAFATMISDPGSFNDNYSTPESHKKVEQFSAILGERDRVLENPDTSQTFKDEYGMIERIGNNLVITRRRSLGEESVDHSSKYMGNENQIRANVSVAKDLREAVKKIQNPTNPQPEPRQVFERGK